MSRPWLTAIAIACILVSTAAVEAQSLPGDLIQSAPFPGTQPIDLCHAPGTNDLYVLDANGETYRFDISNLAAGPNLTLPSPAGLSATTGITTDGFFLYYAVPGNSQTFWRTDLTGGGASALGSFALPNGGNLVGICLDADGNLWASDVTNDRYSQHSIADGSYLGLSFPHPDGAGSGSGIAFRSDCGLFEIPHGAVGAGNVMTLTTVLGPDGVPIQGIDIASIGPLIRGVETVETGSTGNYSIFLVEGSTNQIYEIVGNPPCPLPEIPELMDIVRCSQPVGPSVTECGPAAALPIPDQGTLTDSLAPTETFLIGDLDLSIDVTHPTPSDLTVTLTGPTGTTLTLHNGLGGAGDLLLTFDDEGSPYGSTSIASGASMRPAGPGLLAGFHGLSLNGLWTLEITDTVATNTGTLNSWCLTATPQPGLLIDPVGQTVSDTITITEGSTTLRDLNVGIEITHPFIADLVVSLEGPTGVSLTILDQTVFTSPSLDITFDDDGFGDIPDGPGLLEDFVGTDPNGTWTMSALDAFETETGSLDGWCLYLDEFTAREFCHVPPRAIECTTPGTPISLTTPVSSPISTALTGAIRDLDVALDISHTWIGDLDVTVTSPTATSVVLLSAGNGNIDDIHTTFDDEGSPFSPVLLPGANRLQPQGPGTLADFDGTLIDGTWTLSVTDATSTDDGILESWCLDTQTPLLITDGAGPLQIPFEVPDNVLLEDLELRLLIEHALPGQLQMSLASPSGSVITLTTISPTQPAGIDVTFSSQGVTHDSALLGDGLTMQPAIGNTTDFTGELMQGTWTLSILDSIAGADGRLLEACLGIRGDEIPCEAPGILAGANTTAGPSPLFVQFSTTLSGTTPHTLSWNFGDGTFGTGPAPSHVYATEGNYPVTVTATNPCGIDQASLLIQVCNPIVATPTASTVSGAPPLTVDFTAGTVGTAPLTHLWEFGDGDTSSLADPTHVFNTAGTYVVDFTASNACGLEQGQFVITVCEPVTSLPTASQTSGAPPFEVQFAAGAAGTGPFFYTWDFGDGGTSNSANPVHTYTTDGTFAATVTVINSCGTDVQVLPITVCTPASAVSTASTLAGTVPLTVDFAANAGGTAPLAVTWDFGDGTTSTELSPSHTYTTGGTFLATATVTNACGTASQSFTIVPCAPVTSAASATPDTGPSPLIVSFDAGASGSGPLNAFWTFGDGSISTDLNPTHTYATDGLYNVNLTVTNPCGTTSESLTVAICSPVTLASTADVTVGTTPLTVQFSSGEQGTAPITTQWDFGDTATATGAAPTHTFTAAGTYSVTVLSTNFCSSDTETITIEVCDAVAATPAATIAPGGVQTSVQFSAGATGSGPLGYLWDFGDGNSSTLENPLHDYGTPGQYVATLTVTNPCGSATATTAVDLCSNPTAQFSASTTFGIAPFCVDFTDGSTGQITTSTWDFGDGNTSATIGSTSHTYATAGTFDVSLTVANACAVTSSESVPQLIRVLDAGDVNADGARDITDPIGLLAYIFNGGAAPPCLRTGDVNLDNTIDITDAITLLFWQFADGPVPLSPPCGSCDF